MRRAILIAGASLGLAGCGSFSMPTMDVSMPSLDFFKPAPTNVAVLLESAPPGADARTSLGPSCKTPCTVSVPGPATDGFSVSFTLDKYQPQTVQVQTSQQSGETVTNPSPVFAELQPAAPVKKPAKAKRATKKPAPKTAAAAPAQAQSAFPAPSLGR